MIYCPNCGKEMKEVVSPTHYDRTVVVDQCPDCGGLWFDESEFFQVKVGHAQELENIDIEKLSELTLLKPVPYICPKDGGNLTAYQDAKFFKDLQIMSCQKCAGFWFNRGEFVKYQSRKAEKIEKERAGNLAEAMLKLEAFKEREKQHEQFSKFVSPFVSASTPLGHIRTGDWRIDILIDIIGSILKRVFIR